MRFLHCDAHCRYCDTPLCHEPLEAWRLEVTPGKRDFVEARESRAARIARAASSGSGSLDPVRHAAVAFTGGEPLLQAGAILELAPAIRARGAEVLLETDGNLPDAFDAVRGVIDVLSMDWKLPSATGEPSRAAEHRRMLGSSSGIACYVKAVFVEETPDEEILEAARAVSEARPDAPLVLQPASPCGAVKRAPSPARALHLQQAALRIHRDVRVIPQVHKLAGQM